MSKYADILYKMLKSRLIEEQLVSIIDNKKGNFPLYSSVRQEGVVGAVLALGEDDILFNSHRNIASLIAKDVNESLLIKEILGCEDGICGGKCGASAINLADEKIFSPFSDTSLNFARAVGVATSLKRRNIQGSVLCIVGDGACADGKFYEALNIAAAKELPIIFYIENNEYANRTHISSIHNIQDIAARTKGYGIKSIIINGNDPVEVNMSIGAILENLKIKKEPYVVEAKTYRLIAHRYLDEQDYRTREDIENHLDEDPIEMLVQYMYKHNLATREELLKVRSLIEDEVKTLFEFYYGCEDELDCEEGE